MTRSIAYSLVSCSVWLAITGAAAAQTAVEAGLGAARAATSTAPARGIGKAMSGLVESLDKTLNAGQRDSTEVVTGSTSTRSTGKAPAASTTATATAAPAPKFENPGGIQTGLTYGELVRRFGPPAMEITGEQEKYLTYMDKAGPYQIELRDGKVALVRGPNS